MLVAQVRGNDEVGELFTDRFLTGKTENVFSCRIKFKDPAVRVHDDDTIERIIENAAIQHFELVTSDRIPVSPGFFGFHLGPTCRLRRQD